MRQKLASNLRYCYSARRDTQDMSASRSLPTIYKPLTINWSCLTAETDTARDVVPTKKVWERTQKTSHFKTASNSF